MKKFILLFVAAMLTACSSTTTTTKEDDSSSKVEYVDTYSSASKTRIPMEGDDFNAGIEELMSICGDNATKAMSEEEGYEANEDAKFAQIMTVNPDGSVGMSTIHAWKVEKTDTGASVTVVMTDGQNIQNVLAEGTKCTIMAHGSKYYLMHAKTTNVVTLEYSDEAFEAGEFNVDYSGAENQLTEYTVTFDIYALEGSFVYMFD